MLFLTHKSDYFITEDNEVRQTQLRVSKSILTVPGHIPSHVSHRKGAPKGPDPWLSPGVKWDWPPWIILWAYFKGKWSEMCQHLYDFSKRTKTGTTAPSGPMGSHGSNSLKQSLTLFPFASDCWFVFESCLQTQEPGDLATDDSGKKSTKYLKQVCASLIQPPYSAESLFTLLQSMWR